MDNYTEGGLGASQESEGIAKPDRRRWSRSNSHAILFDLSNRIETNSRKQFGSR